MAPSQQDTPRAVDVPTHWYNLLADLPFELPPDLPSPLVRVGREKVKPQVPLELLRQSMGRQALVEIPEPIREHYRKWRPTPLRRATTLEAHLQTPAKIFIKYEGGNGSGSHKLNTAIAQAYYYKRAGVKRLVTATGAGQWGTALAMACHLFGMECKVYMVGTSYAQKPYRKVVMQMFGAEVVPTPTSDTSVGRDALASGAKTSTSLTLAISEALEEAVSRDDSRFCIGSGELYAILHQTVMGLEAKAQLEALGEYPTVVVGSLGAGSNFGGIAAPFLADRFHGRGQARCLSVEPAACPKMTRGVYAYDYTDSLGISPLQKMYTLGHKFATAGIHAGGLRYHAASKLVSALYDHKLVEAEAYQQRDIFESSVLLARTEDLLPAPESAHAVHAGILEAKRARERGTPSVILISVSGHGHYDMSAYESYLGGAMEDIHVSDGEITASLESLPRV